MTPSPAYHFADLQIDFQLESHTVHQLEILLHQLLDANQTTNLTAITNFQEALVKHIYDSLLILKWVNFNQLYTIADIGSGAGFPALPLAVCQPHKEFMMVEATQKKVNFQISTSQLLHLKNTSSIWGRSEQVAHQPEHRQHYDLVIARAVAATAVLAEITIPFARVGGFIVFYKGQDYQEELQEANYAIQKLGCTRSDIIPFQLPLGLGQRNLIVLQKVDDSPSLYPRHPGTPQKRPLIKVMNNL